MAEREETHSLWKKKHSFMTKASRTRGRRCEKKIFVWSHKDNTLSGKERKEITCPKDVYTSWEDIHEI